MFPHHPSLPKLTANTNCREHSNGPIVLHMPRFPFVVHISVSLLFAGQLCSPLGVVKHVCSKKTDKRRGDASVAHKECLEQKKRTQYQLMIYSSPFENRSLIRKVRAMGSLRQHG